MKPAPPPRRQRFLVAVPLQRGNCGRQRPERSIVGNHHDVASCQPISSSYQPASARPPDETIAARKLC